jgi:hypothetical protein
MFTSLLSWVEQTRGVVTVDRIIAGAGPALSTGGAYTAVGNYPATEFTALLEQLAILDDTTPDDVQREFGKAAFPVLASLHPEWLDGISDLPALLTHIESIIHTEVRKLYPDAQPPLITAQRTDPGIVEVTYVSHRGLVPMCQGLIEGAAQFFGDAEDISLVEAERTGDTTRAVMQVRMARDA